MGDEKKTYDLTNILRIVLAYTVIMLHTIAFSSVNEFMTVWTSNYLCRIAVPFFFATSGFFFYSKYKQPEYFKKYITKLIVIYVTVTFIYSIFIVPVQLESFKELGIGYILKTFLFNGISPALWYFPALILSTAFVYLLIKHNSFKLLGTISIFLFLIGVAGDSYYNLIVSTPIVNIVNGYNLIFDNTRNGITFGVPFIVLGLFVNKYKLHTKIKHLKPLFFIFMIIFAVEVHYLMYFNISKDYNIFFSVCLLAPILLMISLTSNIKISSEASNYFRDMSLWIYAFHELIQFLGLKNGFLYSNSFANYLIICGIVTFISYFISRFRLKKSKPSKSFSRKVILNSIFVVIIPVILFNTFNADGDTNSVDLKKRFKYTESKANTDITGPLWKVSDEDSSIYIFSNLNSGSEDMYPLSDTFQNAFDDSDEILLFKSEDNVGKSFYDKIFYRDSDKLPDHISSEAYDIIENKCKDTGLYSEFRNDINDVTSQYLYTLLDEKLAIKNAKAIYYDTDSYLEYLCKKTGKKLDYLNSDSKLFLQFTDRSDDNINNAYAMLSKYLGNSDEEEVFNYWKEGKLDEAKNCRNRIEFSDDADKQNYEKYSSIVLNYISPIKNQAMDNALEQIENNLESNTTCFVSIDFISFNMVGIYGADTDIFNILQDKGYTIEKLI